MQITNNKFVNTKTLEASIFLLMGAAKTVYDYRSVGEKYKRKILLNDVVVLSSCSAGMIGYKALGHNKFLRNKVFKPTVDYVDKLIPKKNFIETPKHIIANCVSNTAMVGAGLFSAILGDYALSKNGLGIHKLKNIMDSDKPQKLELVENFKKKNVDNVVSKKVQEEMFWRMTDFKAFDAFNSAFVGLAGLDITDDEKYSKQVKNASKYLLLNTMIPLFFFSLSSSLTKNLKTLYRLPIMFTSLVTASLLVKKFLDKKA